MKKYWYVTLVLSGLLVSILSGCLKNENSNSQPKEQTSKDLDENAFVIETLVKGIKIIEKEGPESNLSMTVIIDGHEMRIRVTHLPDCECFKDSVK